MTLTPAPDWPFLAETVERGLYGDVLMTNYDHSVNHEVADKLRSGQYRAEFTGWNFHAACWYHADRFWAEVSVFGQHRATFDAETPEQLMAAVNERFGWQ
jgi:hypothetical protein